MSEALRTRAADELSPYEALLRSFGYLRRISAEEHAAVRAILERAVQKAPSQADCWAMLSAMYTNEYIHGFNALPDPLGRALQSARRAVEAAPSNHFAHYALAEALFFRREVQPFRQAAERVVALNRMDGYSTAYMTCPSSSPAGPSRSPRRCPSRGRSPKPSKRRTNRASSTAT